MARTSRILTLTVTLLTLLLAGAAVALADGEHVHPTPNPPGLGDARFMPGTVGPVVFRGTAATVTIPDGPGFGGERGRRQNSGDLRKNNYSVTDANFNNVLGLLARNPDTGAELTYVQHIQLYAAAGYIETFAPDVYAHMIMHQNAGTGTVLGASGYLMGLLATYDGAAHGLASASIPASLPGTSMASRSYVRATRDATGQEWARPHHAQTAPGVYKMLVDSGLTSSAALILASDDGISGAGRLNGMNEQDGSKDGFNSGERATWAFAAQLQAQTGVPVISHMMHGHDHAGIDSSALTRSKINPLIGMTAEDRTASDARAAALQAALTDGRVATPATAAADQNLTVRNEFYLRPRSTLKLDMDAPFDRDQNVGAEQVIKIVVRNDGPHVAQDVVVAFQSSKNLVITSIAAPTNTTCMGASMCHFGDISAETNRERVLNVTVRFTAAGTTRFEARLTTTSNVELDELYERREHTAQGSSTATIGMAASSMGVRTSACGFTLKKMCVVLRVRGTSFVATVRPSAMLGSSNRRWVQVVYEQRAGKMWKQRADHWVRVSAKGQARVRANTSKLTAKGVWRVRVIAKDHEQLRGATSTYKYVLVR